MIEVRVIQLLNYLEIWRKVFRFYKRRLSEYTALLKQNAITTN